MDLKFLRLARMEKNVVVAVLQGKIIMKHHLSDPQL